MKSVDFPAPPQGRFTYLALAAVIALTIVAYIPSYGNGFIWDDDQYVSLNPYLRTVDGLQRIWFDVGATPQYYPLTFTTFWLERRLWGESPAGYHVTNALLHGLGAGLLWLVLRQLGLGSFTSWVAAAVFAVHPVHVESVAWITERKNVLAGVFYFAAALAYLRFIHDASESPQAKPPLPPREGRGEGRRARALCCYGLALTLFVCALLSKTVTCTLPAAILLMIWWKRGRIAVRDVVPTLPLFAFGIAMGLLTACVERQHVWAGESTYDYSLLERALIAGRVVWFYACKLIWPAELVFIYPRWTIDAHRWTQYLYPLAAIALLAALWLLRHRVGRGPLAAALFFGGTLLPALGFFDVFPFQFSFVADHFQYLASVGVTTVIVCACMHVLDRMKPHARAVIARVVFVIIILGLLAALTWRQQAMYENLETLWSDTLAKNDQAFLAHSNYGALLAERGQIALGMEHQQKALAIRPGYSFAHYNLGNAYFHAGNNAKAIEHYRQALASNRRMYNAHFNLGQALARAGEAMEALRHFKAAAEFSRNSPFVHAMAGRAALELGDPATAARLLRKAIELGGETPDLRDLLRRAERASVTNQ